MNLRKTETHSLVSRLVTLPVSASASSMRHVRTGARAGASAACCMRSIVKWMVLRQLSRSLLGFFVSYRQGGSCKSGKAAERKQYSQPK